MSEEEKSGNVVLEEFLTPGKRPGADDLSIVAESATNANISSKYENRHCRSTIPPETVVRAGTTEFRRLTSCAVDAKRQRIVSDRTRYFESGGRADD
jgi:3-methyladenine DNA glycosylase/8-oxoguanine DNA glycosylase